MAHSRAKLTAEGRRLLLLVWCRGITPDEAASLSGTTAIVRIPRTHPQAAALELASRPSDGPEPHRVDNRPFVESRP